MPPEPGKLVDLNVTAKPKVIVADDEQDIASLIEDWLAENYEVTIALNGKAAIQKAVWQKPNVILCDIVMPDMGGYEVARSLQGNAATQDIPLIIMTAKIYDDSTVKLIKAEPNVRGFIVKPFKPSELLKMIEAVIGGQRTFSPLPASEPVVSASPAAFQAPPPPAPSQGYGTGGGPRGPETPPDPRAGQRAMDRNDSTMVIPPPAPPPLPPKPIGGFPQPAASLSSGEDGRRESFAAKFLRAAIVWAAKGLVLLALILGTGEGVARWSSRLQGEAFLPPVRPARKAALPYQFAEGAQWRQNGVEYKINSWGLRGADFPLVAPPGTTRVLLLGGTQAFGVGIDESAVLAERLREALGSGPAVQVINAAHWAYSPEEQWAYFEEEGLQFRPQVIVWLMEPRPEKGPTAEGLRQLTETPLARAAAAGSHLARLAVLRWSRSGPPEAPADPNKLIEKARAFSRSHEGKLLVWPSPALGAGRSAGRAAWPVKRAEEAFGALMAERLSGYVGPIVSDSSGQK